MGDQITTEFNYIINPIWKFRIYERMDTTEGILREQEYTLTRDMHECNLDMIFNSKHDGGQEILFALTFKAFPDMGISGSSTLSRSTRGTNQ